VVTVQRYRDLAPLFEQISAAEYGLHCGIFTKSIQVAFDAIRALRVGGGDRQRHFDLAHRPARVWRHQIEAASGAKGRRYAMRDMTEERLVLFQSVAFASGARVAASGFRHGVSSYNQPHERRISPVPRAGQSERRT